VTAHEGGWICVYNSQLQFVSGWPKSIGSGEVRSLTVADIDADGKKEIIVGYTRSDVNVYIFNMDGTSKPGWPQKQPATKGYVAGIYNHNVAAFDLLTTNTGKEIIAPSDVHYIMAYTKAGVPIAANSDKYGTKTWGEVGVFANIADELQGYGDCSTTSNTWRPNFAGSRPTFSDVDQNGVPEVMVVGNVYDCGYSDTAYLYFGPYILKRDRSRFAPYSYWNWTDAPKNTGVHLYPIGDYNTIQDVQPNVVAADLDGDGRREFIYPSYDAHLKVFWLNKEQKYNWPNLNLKGQLPTEPIVIDIKNDGHAEVIFATYPTQVAGNIGRLYMIDYMGNVLYNVSLPTPSAESNQWNGVLAAPTIGNIDADADLEVVLNTWSTGLVAYKLPGSAGARIIWGTGALNYDRNPDEYAWATNRCTTCKNNCYTANSCGTNPTCKNNCATTCKNNRGCY
jgi:hypothetical protein